MSTAMAITREEAHGALVAIATSCPKTGDVAQARWQRDVLLMAWALYHPERIAEFFRVTWQPDNTGHIREGPHGCWLYRNVAAAPDAATKSEYRLAPQVESLLPAYLTNARPKLVKPSTDMLLNMPSNHIQTRLGNLLMRHLGRGVTYSDLRQLRM